MIDLSNVTAILIDGRSFSPEMKEQLSRVVHFLQVHFKFASIKLGIRDKGDAPVGTEVFEVPAMVIDDYSRFCIESLTDHIQTEFCMIFQLDGFPLNPHLWSPDFLKYDYIGAPWRAQESYPGRQVGNGGISIRSKKLLDLCREKGYKSGNEDGVICVWDRDWFESRGVKYAPVDVARRFAVERPLDDQHTKETCFAQHSHVFDPNGYYAHAFPSLDFLRP